MEFHHFQNKINLILNYTEAKTKILLPEVISFDEFYSLCSYGIRVTWMSTFSLVHMLFSSLLALINLQMFGLGTSPPSHAHLLLIYMIVN